MPAVRRGSVCELTGTPFESGVVLTADDWNDRMGSVGVAPLVGEPPDTKPPWAIPLPFGLWAVIGRVLDVPLEYIGREQRQLNASELRTIEDAWLDVLALRPLLDSPPQAPAPGPGGAYPRWSRTYYVRKTIKGEQKFYAVFSPDGWNHVAPAVTVVRATSRPRGREFPEIVRGTHACAGNVTTFPVTMLDVARPTPVRHVPLDAMRRIAAAIATTHALGPALGISDASLEAILS